jgi:hypothetical protein
MSTDAVTRHSNDYPTPPVGSAREQPKPAPDGRDDNAKAGHVPQAFADKARNIRLRYQELFEFAPTGYLVTDTRGIIHEANHAAAALMSCSKQFLLDKPLGFFLRENDRKSFYQYLAVPCHALACEVQLCCPGGLRRDVVLSAIPLPSEAEQQSVLRWTVQDITRLHNAQNALSEQTQFTDSLIEAAEAAILVLDPAGRILRSNQFLHDISGYPESELHHLSIRWYEKLIDLEDRPEAIKFLWQAIDVGFVRGQILTLVTRQGLRRAFSWSARRVESSNTTTVTVVGHDVTELREAQQRGIQAERLAMIGKTATVLAHETRDTLQRTQSCLSVLRLRLQDRPDTFELMDRLQRAQDDLHYLFDGVRNFAAPILLERQGTSVEKIWRQAWEDLAAARVERRVELREIGSAIDLQCPVDPFRMKQVFRNLFENAIALGQDEVTIEVRCAPVHQNGIAALQIAVCDNGPGFNPEQRKRAFEPFYTTKSRGTGLGLTISRRIVEAHGGTIEISVNVAKGAEILVTLPRSLS